MRHNSTFYLALLSFLIGTATLTYAQVDPETDSIATDSADWEQDVLLSESIIVGKGVIDLEENRKTPVAVSTITKQEIQDKSVGNVEFPEVMKHTPSVYVTNQASGFGDGQMFLRGFDQSNTAFLLNGQPINGMEDGNMYWSNWSSMLDVANAVQVQRGLGSSKLAISSVGGTVNIVTKATERNQGGMARFVVGNDGFMKGTMSYDSGLQGKWGFSVALDYWTAHRKYARGTSGEGQSYFVSVGYKPNDRHNINFMVFGAPQVHGQKWSNTQSEYAQFGHKYNENYGMYNGEGHNLVENYYHKPVANLNWDWSINNDLSLSTVVYASMGRGGGTGIFGANASASNGIRMGDGYLDFDQAEIYNAGIANGIGVGSNGFSKRASVNNHFWYGAVTNLNYDLNESWSFNVGADVRFYKGDHFRQLVETYGLNGWEVTNDNLGTYQVTETFDATPWASLFDFADEGQRIGYDNSEKLNYQGGFGQVEFNMSGFSAFVQGAVSNQFYQKFDRWNYEGGEAESVKVNKIGYNVKGGLAYNILEGDHTVFVNAGHYSRQPFLDNVFVQNTVDLRDPEVDNEEITGFEVGYKYATRALKVNVNLYHTKWANRFVTYGIRDDRNYPVEGTTPQEFRDVDYMLSDQTQIHKGVEVDFETKLARKWTLRGFASYGDWQLEGSSPYTVRDQNSFDIIDSGKDVDLDGIYVGSTAQFTFGLGTQFEICKGFSIDSDLNYYSSLYADPNIGTIAVNQNLDPNYDFKPENLAPFANLDAGLTYEYKLGGKQSIRFRGNVKNVTNTTFVARKQGNDYFLGLGRTYNAGIQYNF